METVEAASAPGCLNGSWNPRQMAVAAGDDLYSLLGVPVTASPQQIADARRRLMRTWHLDLIPSSDALAKSKAINRAAHNLARPRPAPELRRVSAQRGAAPRGPQTTAATGGRHLPSRPRRSGRRGWRLMWSGGSGGTRDPRP